MFYKHIVYIACLSMETPKKLREETECSLIEQYYLHHDCHKVLFEHEGVFDERWNNRALAHDL